MKKIPNLFERDWNGDRSRVLPQLNPDGDVEWVLRGEGVATVKWDGSAVMVRGGELFVRFDAKRGKAAPAGFEPCQDEDPKTGHRPGWIPAVGNPAAKWHLDAFVNSAPAADPFEAWADGTYEAVGPQLQSNPYRFPRNILIRHGVHPIVTDSGVPLAEKLRFEGPLDPVGAARYARAYLFGFLSGYSFKHDEMPEAKGIEGIVWHHTDGRMVKVLASDLGLSWKAKARAA